MRQPATSELFKPYESISQAQISGGSLGLHFSIISIIARCGEGESVKYPAVLEPGGLNVERACWVFHGDR